MGNWAKTTLLLGLMTALIVFIGGLFGGKQGMIVAFVLAMGMNFFSYWYSDKIVLRMYRATEVNLQDFPTLFQAVNRLARNAGLPMPRVYIIPDASPNAFATGRDPEHAVIAVTEGLLRTMNNEEATGVLAHEMSHIKNRDILIGSIAATMAGAIMILATMARWSAFFGGGSQDDEGGGGMGMIGLIAMSILAPIAAMLIQMAISRSREYLADATGAQIAGNPEGLANALGKLGAYAKQIPMKAQPATAHMFIVNPLSGRKMANLFSTHPPMEDRIARLRGSRGTTPPADTHEYRQTGESRGEQEARSMWDRLSK
ncbi:MAG: zinc metalloprotease HtpX [Deltaproteobacteria bacterium]|nr:zinc metalloprotease HtpX [Deltaproteobacteria bacterium]